MNKSNIRYFCPFCGKERSYDSVRQGCKGCLQCYLKSNIGKNHRHFGKHRTEETKKKMSIAAKKRIKKYPYTLPTKNKHHTKETIEKMKKAAKGRLPNHIKRIKYKNLQMRSTWEIKYAKYLDKQGIKWLYESKTFDLGNTTYTPDFYLPETKEYIEIKGYWHNDALNKFLAFELLYPEIKIKILQKSELIKLGIKL